jgi:hypothetical protein
MKATSFLQAFLGASFWASAAFADLGGKVLVSGSGFPGTPIPAPPYPVLGYTSRARLTRAPLPTRTGCFICRSTRLEP